jgi:hypothetical protein
MRSPVVWSGPPTVIRLGSKALCFHYRSFGNHYRPGRQSDRCTVVTRGLPRCLQWYQGMGLGRFRGLQRHIDRLLCCRKPIQPDFTNRHPTVGLAVPGRAFGMHSTTMYMPRMSSITCFTALSTHFQADLAGRSWSCLVPCSMPSRFTPCGYHNRPHIRCSLAAINA